MQDALEVVVDLVVYLVEFVMGVGAIWAVIDAIATRSHRFKAAGRNKWLWILGSFFIPYMGVYYVCVVRRQVKGSIWPKWTGDAALVLGAVLAVLCLVAVVTDQMGGYVLLWLPTSVLLYLGLHPEEWSYATLGGKVPQIHQQVLEV